MDPKKKQSGMEGFVARPVELTDLADYQEGSVVSRTIIDKKTGTVTFFAFDEGQGLSEHTAPFDALVNQPHSLKAVKKFKMILTMIRS
jgi:hypothetical protein